MRFSVSIKTALILATFLAGLSQGQVAESEKDADADAKPVDVKKLRQEIVGKGLKFLAEQGQAENGSFTERAGAGITALAVTSALRNENRLTIR